MNKDRQGGVAVTRTVRTHYRYKRHPGSAPRRSRSRGRANHRRPKQAGHRHIRKPAKVLQPGLLAETPEEHQRRVDAA